MLLLSCFFLLVSCRFPGAVRPTLKIGLVAPFEGRYRYVGYDVIYAVRLAVREVNATGGVGGYNVELVAYDDAADDAADAATVTTAVTAVATEQARKLAVDPQVVAAIGHFREETTAAAAGIYAEAGIPLISPTALQPVSDALANALLRRVEALGQSQAALLTDGGPLGQAVQRNAAAHGMRVEPVVSPDDGGWVSEVLGSGVGIVLCDIPTVAAGEAAALLHSRWEGIFLGGPDLAAADFAAVAGEVAEGVEFVTPWPFPADVPDAVTVTGEDFTAAYQAVSPHVPPPGPLALPAYEAAWALFAALEQATAEGQPTRAGVAAALTAAQSASEGGEALLYWYRIDAEGVPRWQGEE